MSGRRSKVPVALALALAVIAGAAGSAAAYWVAHHGPAERAAERTYQVELAPTHPGPYVAYVPVPGDGARLALRVLEGEPRFSLVHTEHGPALSVAAEGRVRLAGEVGGPFRLSLDDPDFGFRQFKFWSWLGRGAAGPVLAKVELREGAHHEDWDTHVDTGRAIVVQQALQPRGWQVVKAVQLFDLQVQGGHGEGFPPLALGAVATSLVALYVPLGAVLLRRP